MIQLMMLQRSSAARKTRILLTLWVLEGLIRGVLLLHLHTDITQVYCRGPARGQPELQPELQPEVEPTQVEPELQQELQPEGGGGFMAAKPSNPALATKKKKSILPTHPGFDPWGPVCPPEERTGRLILVNFLKAYP